MIRRTAASVMTLMAAASLAFAWSPPAVDRSPDQSRIDLQQEPSVAQPVAGETIICQPTAIVHWDDMVRDEQTRQAAGMVPEPLVIERMPGPEPRPVPKRESTPFVPIPTDRMSSPAPRINTRVSCAPSAREPLLVRSFAALGDNNLAIPPDTMGAVGPSHLMTMLNTEVRIQSKHGAVLSTVRLSTFWSPLGGAPFAPKLLFDSLSGRWIATCVANARQSISAVYFAISDTSDPLGTWRFYSFDADSQDTLWADYPGLGMNNTWIAITNNMFPNAGGPFIGAKMWVIDKASALAGEALTVTVFPPEFDLSGGIAGFTLIPCVTFDNTEPTLYLVDNNGWYDPIDQRYMIRVSRITGTASAPVWSVVPGSNFPSSGLFSVINNFQGSNFQYDAPQLGDARLIDTNDGRVINAVFRNGHIWFAHMGVPSPANLGQTAVFWYQVSASSLPTPIVQSGVLDGGANVHYMFPSIAVNCADDVCIGFTRCDATRYAEAVYTTRLATDSAGVMQPIQLLKGGLSPYFKTFSTSRNRWGDYSATCVDPVDDRTFWTIQEYADQRVGPADNDSRWGTWWGQIAASDSTEQFDVRWFTRDGGGGISGSGAFRVAGTVGQPDSGPPMSGEDYGVINGFWAATAGPCGIVGVPCPEACCLPDGSCSEMRPPNCAALGGTSQGADSTCPTVSCPQPEACCLADGSCQDMLPTQCTASDGTAQGMASICSTSICPQPEACCLVDGSCMDLLASRCLAIGGTTQGPASACGASSCPQPQQCCFPYGFKCVFMIPSMCTALGGISESYGCFPGACPELQPCDSTVYQNTGSYVGYIFGDQNGVPVYDDIRLAGTDRAICGLRIRAGGMSNSGETIPVVVQLRGGNVFPDCPDDPSSPILFEAQFPLLLRNPPGIHEIPIIPPVLVEGDFLWVGLSTPAGLGPNDAFWAVAGLAEIGSTDDLMVIPNGNGACEDLGPGQADDYFYFGGDPHAGFEVEILASPASTPSCSTCQGDIDGDGDADGQDVQGMVDCIVKGLACECTDLDNDGSAANVDVMDDLSAFVSKLLMDLDPSCP